MKQLTQSMDDSSLSVWSIVKANAEKLSSDGIEQRKFVLDSYNLIQNLFPTLDHSIAARKYLNTLARVNTNALKMKNIALAFRVMEIDEEVEN